MILVRSCSLIAVIDLLAQLLGQSFNTMRERLRNTFQNADAEAGKLPTELDVTLCWTPCLHGYWTDGRDTNRPSPWMRRVW